MAKIVKVRFMLPSDLLKTMLVLLIKIYQLTRVVRPSCCRFYPSCSDYCSQAIDAYGIIKGLALTTKRLFKCHPCHRGGVDLVLHSCEREAAFK